MYQKTKTLALSALNKTGVFNIAKFMTRNRIRILTYHRFGEGHVTDRSFETQIEYLKKYYNIIDIATCLDFLGGEKKLPANSVLITVDDGYEDFYTIAFPILKQYKVPALVFLTVDFIDKEIWLKHDLLNFAIDNTNRRDFEFNGTIFDLTHQKGRAKLKLSLDETYKSYDLEKRDRFTDQILKSLNVSVPEQPTLKFAPLTWSQVLEMSIYGVSYGAHTCTHPILSRIPSHEAYKEIRESKKRIEEVLQKNLLAFCYPNGKENDFNEKVKNMVKECGFECAMTMIYGLNDVGSDSYALKRMAVGDSFVHFLQDVSGVGALRSSFRGLKRKLLKSSVEKTE